MMDKRWVFLVLMVGLFIVGTPACGGGGKPRPTLTPAPSSTPFVPTATPVTPTALPPTPTFTPLPPTATPAGPALTDVEFALDIDETGQLVYPATEFVFGITRVYVRFAYQGLADAATVRSVWYLNDNPVISDTLTWDGGDAGDYVIWMADPNGVGRGEWRWELKADGVVLGNGAFTVGGEPRYANPAWGVSFDPPASWQLASEQEGFVTFSSPDQRQALALRVAPATSSLTQTAAADVTLFQQDHPDAEVAATQAVTLGGEEALLQQVNYTGAGGGDRVLYIASSLHAGTAYSLWVLGPVEEESVLRELLAATLRSVRFE